MVTLERGREREREREKERERGEYDVARHRVKRKKVWVKGRSERLIERGKRER